MSDEDPVTEGVPSSQQHEPGYYTETGVTQVGQGSWGGWGLTITDEGVKYKPQKGSDPFEEGRLIPGVQYEIDWERVREWAEAHSIEIAASALVGSMTYMALQEPEKYTALVGVMQRLITETIKGIGEVVPG